MFYKSINYLIAIILIIIKNINCKQQFILAQHINQCSNDEYFNINLLKCSKCESTFDHSTAIDYFSSLYSKNFNPTFSSSNLMLVDQNLTFNSNLESTSSVAIAANLIQQTTSNLERSEDGLHCVCKSGYFRSKKHDSKLVKELVCLKCPNQMVSSLDRTRCSFCKKIPKNYLNNNSELYSTANINQQISSSEKVKMSNECNLCSDNEILIERLIDSTELVNLNKTALISDYNFSLEFNLAHLDQYLIQECRKCPLQTKSINNQCKVCHFSFYENCSCPKENGYKIQNGVCIVENQILKFNQELFRINYTLDDNDNNLNNELKSSFIESNFHSSFSQCIHYHNITACQQFANLCVLNNFRLKFKSNKPTTICDLYEKIIMDKEIPIDYLPQIYFNDGNTKNYLFNTDLPIKFKLNERLRFYIVVFNANGQLKDSREVYLDELLICGNKDQSMDSIVRFAVNINLKCKIKLNRLFKYTSIDADNQLFYELYLILNHTISNSSSETSGNSDSNNNYTLNNKYLYPIYILNRNLIKDDKFINKIDYNLDYFNYYMDHSNYFSEMINQWQLVKRFFIFEQITSKEVINQGKILTTSNNINNQFNDNQNNKINKYGNILRYIQNMKLMIRINSDNPDQIYPPLLILDYNKITKQQLNEHPSKTIEIEFTVNFESNELNLYRKLTIFLAVFCSLTVFLSLFRTWAYSKRSNRDNINLTILFKFILFNCDYLANIFFILVLLISLNSYLIFKFQSVVYGFLPSKSVEHYIQLYIIIAFCLKSISILHEFYIRSDIEIFFIDWERSKSITKTSNLLNNKFNNGYNLNHNTPSNIAKTEEETDNHLYKYLNQIQHNLNGNGHNQSAVNGNSENLQQKLIPLNQKLNNDNEQFIKSSQLINQFNQNAKYIDQYPEVSIWRTLFVANEFFELSTYRRVSINYHLFILLIILQCFGIENFVKSDLELNFNLKETQRFVANSFTSRFVVGCLTFLITVLTNYIFTKYYLEPFISDKISEFVDFCSVSNVSIFCLMYERFGYYVHGRNPTGKSEVNMPEMHHNLLTEEEDLCGRRGLLSNSDIQCFQMFLNYKLVMNYKKIRALLKQKTQNGLRVALHKAQNVQKIWYSYYLMNKLLTGFIDHMFVEMDYLVKERSVIEMLIDAEFNDPQMIDKSIFYTDKSHSFENVLFVGIELDVIFYELMFFTLIDLFYCNFIAAISFTFILNQILERAFIAMTRKNLVNKSLVDSRFLL